MNELWNRCDECGKFIAFEDFVQNLAKREIITPDSHFTEEKYETLCKDCNKNEKN